MTRPGAIYCGDCMKQNEEMKQFEKQRKRDKAFASPWDYIGDNK